jgi:excisionase family DNA binding protein
MLLTVDQAAERLGTTPRFIRRLRAERRIAVIKLGKHIRIDSNDLDAYITASRRNPTAELRERVAARPIITVHRSGGSGPG